MKGLSQDERRKGRKEERNIISGSASYTIKNGAELLIVWSIN